MCACIILLLCLSFIIKGKLYFIFFLKQKINKTIDKEKHILKIYNNILYLYHTNFSPSFFSNPLPDQHFFFYNDNQK